MKNKKFNDQYVENFCNNVTMLRKKNNLTQKEMAKICKIGVKSLSLIEHGTLPQRISADVLFSIQRHFQIPVHKLFDTGLI